MTIPSDESPSIKAERYSAERAGEGKAKWSQGQDFIDPVGQEKSHQGSK